MKTFNTMSNVGSSKYIVNFHDGQKRHSDGSPFFDVALFSNKRKERAFVRSLKDQGYVAKDPVWAGEKVPSDSPATAVA